MRSFENDGYGQFMYNQPVQRTSSQGNCGINSQNLNGTVGQCGNGSPFYVQNGNMLAAQGGCESGCGNTSAQNTCGVSGNIPLAQNGCGLSGNNALAQNGCGTSGSNALAQNGCGASASNALAQNSCGASANNALAQNGCGTSGSNNLAQNGCGASGSNALAQNGCVQNGSTLAGQSPCQDLYLAADGTVCKNGEPFAQNYNGCNCNTNTSQAALASAGALGRCMYQCLTPAFFNGIYNGGNQDVAPEGEVCFLQAYQTGDFKFTPNCPVITCNTPGIYRIDYALTLRPSVGQINAAYAVAICGEEHPFSCFGCYADGLADEERQELYGSFLTNLKAGETLVLKNKSNTCNYLSSCTPAPQTVNRASILIQRIA